MNTLLTQPNENSSTPSTAAAVLERIEAEKLTPTPRYAFTVREYTLWGMWGTSVVVGALAVAVTMYDALSMQYAFYEATHDNIWTFLVDALPFLWVIVFTIMIVVAVNGLKHTKHGYRYRTRYIIVSSILLSIFGGILFHVFGFGYLLDTELGQQLNRYSSMEKKELNLWQAPEEGRLIGTLLRREGEELEIPTVLYFQDMYGEIWTISDGELNAREMMLLATENRVRLLGTSTAPSVFHVCGVFPWMYERAMARSEMQQERLKFEQKMTAHKQMMAPDPTLTPERPEPIPIDALCAHLEMMERMQ